MLGSSISRPFVPPDPLGGSEIGFARGAVTNGEGDYQLT